MERLLTLFFLGAVLLVMGVLNCKGDLRSLHHYHRRRVAEADVPAFGKAVGLGSILCACGCLFFALFDLLAMLTACTALTLVGTCGLVLGMAVGIVLSLYAIIKYNKGLF